MKKKITFACGCVREVNVKKQSTAFWLEKKTCYVCEALEEVEDNGWPSLKGTEKQKNWARQIRWKWVKASYINKSTSYIVDKIKDHRDASDWICYELNGYFDQPSSKKVGEVNWNE